MAEPTDNDELTTYYMMKWGTSTDEERRNIEEFLNEISTSNANILKKKLDTLTDLYLENLDIKELVELESKYHHISNRILDILNRRCSHNFTNQYIGTRIFGGFYSVCRLCGYKICLE